LLAFTFTRNISLSIPHMYARRILCFVFEHFLDVATRKFSHKNRFSCIGTQVHRYGTVVTVPKKTTFVFGPVKV
jgi:hypothetical protein